ncbi:MAG: Glucose-1-phosphate adenylyltransferase [Chlamydiia bacterium]|nr:Glucose-1-phosphate adenylyltransferase [Chlamydiia bacterium]
MHNPLIFILAGGEGTRLRPLTGHRCKPAVPFGGRYRLIDIAISNALKKGYSEVYAITQFLEKSLSSYVKDAYEDKVSLLPPQRNPYLGTADSIRKNMNVLQNSSSEYVVILSGDQLYSMDLDDILENAQKSGADLTIATLPINEQEAHRMGVMKIKKDKEIIDFVEKPKEESLLKAFSLGRKETHIIHALDERIFLGSMGIYVFKRDALISLLQEYNGTDFGMHIIPEQLKRGKTFAYIFDGYWEDIGTIKSYYNANLKLIQSKHTLDIFSKDSLLLTHGSTLPPPVIENCLVQKSLLTDGCIINAKEICHSLIGLNTHVGKGSVLVGVLSLGSLSNGGHSSIGENCYLEKVIIDENAVIEDGVTLSLHGKSFPDGDIGPVTIKDGIIIVKQGARVPHNFHIIEHRSRLSA